MKHLVVAISLLVPALAHADGVTSTAAPRAEVDRSHVDAVVGIFNPLGIFAADYTYVASPHFEISAGAGFDSLLAFTANSSLGTLQVGVMPRARYSLGRFTFTAGAGLSEGRFSPCSEWASGCDAPHALRASAEVGAEAALFGFVTRMYFGGSFVTPLEHTNDWNMDSAMHSYPYLGLALGHRI